MKLKIKIKAKYLIKGMSTRDVPKTAGRRAAGPRLRRKHPAVLLSSRQV
ncbi:MAG: hypothetical protein HUU32_20085 [Calditrichaceae bacterium]|nr:hypothetical protein [Calditrichia bacterium]NUQ43698.1 hypothetical protein [Calditrichaceae bacterium]